ncbi:MAG: PAS domain S-box protein [Candidatus Acidiferrales bacterium]
MSTNIADQLPADPFHLFVDSIQDYAIFMLDPRGNVMTWNAGAQRIKGYETSEIVGRHFSCFYPSEDVELGKPQELLDEAAAKGRVEYEGWRLRKDGSRFWANVVLTAVRDRDGRLIAFGKVTRDLTERMGAQKAVEESSKKLEQSEHSLRELSRYLLRAQDEERRLIGREMHDSLGQVLSVLKMKIDAARAHDSSVSQELSQCASLVEQAVTEVRTVSYLLYPPMLEEMGLGSAIPWYLDGFAKRSGITVTYDIPDNFGRLQRDSELALFRVLQEGLTNVHKHSGSSNATVRIRRLHDKVVLELMDPGKGFATEVLQAPAANWGVGLRGMSERLRQLGGDLQITSGVSGTQLRATVPLGNDTDAH